MRYLRIAFAMAGAVMMLGSSNAGTRQRATVILSENPRVRAVQEASGWADSIRVGDTIYVSGVIAARNPGDANMEEAFERAFVQLGAILKRAGADWDDVVEIESFHTDPSAQFAAITKVKSRYVKAPFPAWTAVGTSALLNPNGIAEIKLVARVTR